MILSIEIINIIVDPKKKIRTSVPGVWPCNVICNVRSSMIILFYIVV